MKLTLSDEQVTTIIAALDSYAQSEAGQTQRPDLCEPADYEEFDLARDLERRLYKSRVLRDQWETHPQTGETVRKST